MRGEIFLVKIPVVFYYYFFIYLCFCFIFFICFFHFFICMCLFVCAIIFCGSFVILLWCYLIKNEINITKKVCIFYQLFQQISFLSLLFLFFCLICFEFKVTFVDFLYNICVIIVYIGSKCSVILFPSNIF